MRQRRRLSQLDLALDAGISARHLSFIETGRSKPGREVLLRITEHLELPLRERNQLLLTAGFAPAFPELPLEDPALAPVREALDVILAGHEPYPAVVVDRNWNIVAASTVMIQIADLIDATLLEPPVNAMRAGLHPKGLAPWIANLTEVRAYFLGRLERQVAMTGDQDLSTLLEEVASYPAPEQAYEPAEVSRAGGILTPQMRIRLRDVGELSFFATVLTFGTAAEVSASELSIELGFPADATTAAILKRLAGDLPGPSRPGPS
jgi:transcriptional regulator with XRE-family HTH domain